MNDITPIQVAPSAQRMSARMGSLKATAVGSRIEDVVQGRKIVWELVQVPADKLAQATLVYGLNERAQALLDQTTLADILTSLDPEHGNDELAKGRRVNGLIEVANGSRRRAACLLKGAPYNILVCDDLTDPEMEYLTEVGNLYNPTSAWERGHTYARLERQLGSLRQVEECLAKRGTPVSRRTIARCIRTAELPLALIKRLRNPGSLSPADGEQIAAQLAGYLDDEGIEQIEHDLMALDHGQEEDADEITIAFLKAWQPAGEQQTAPAAKPSPEKAAPIIHSWASGKLTVAGRKLTLQLNNRMPEHDRQQLEQKIAELMFDYELPVELRGGYLTREAYLEYQDKLGQVCAELSVAPSILEPALLARFAEALAKHGLAAKSAGMLLNIRVMRATCQELVAGMR